MTQQLTEDQIVAAIEKLPPQAKRNVLRKLLGDMEKFEKIVQANHKKLISLCKERGIDFYALNEEERIELIDRIIHED